MLRCCGMARRGRGGGCCLCSFAEAEQEEAIKAEQHPLLPFSQTAAI